MDQGFKYLQTEEIEEQVKTKKDATFVNKDQLYDDHQLDTDE